VRSGLYEGRLSHHRYAHRATGEVAHAFGYDVAYPLVFLDELDEVLGLHPLWSRRGPSPVWFRRADYLGDPSVALSDAVRDAAEAWLGRRPTGPIAMLAHLRTWGWSFNPLSIYYCYDERCVDVEAVVLEVTSTPWLERHVYVVDAPEARFAKAMHVSPFMDMACDYELTWTPPGEQLTARLRNVVGDEPVFDARMTLRRRELSRQVLGGLVWHDPQPSFRASAAIYRQALALARKGAPFHARRSAKIEVPNLAHSEGGASG